MLYIGLVVGAMLGACVSMILLVVIKEYMVHSRTDKAPPELL